MFGLLSNQIFPSYKSTIFLTIDKPIPEESLLLFNDSNILNICL